MRRTFCAVAITVTTVMTAIPSVPAQKPTLLTPVDATGGILDAFNTHDLIAMPDAHGNPESHAFRLALIKDSRFAAVVEDIVIETGNALHQDVADRYVRGEDIPRQDLRRIWQDTTVTTAGNNYEWTKELLDTVRGVNALRGGDSRWLRVLLGDPPIEWSRVRDRAEYRKYFQHRQSHPAAIIISEVLARQRKALVIYGSLHLQRRNIQTNYEMDAYQAQTIVGLVERATPVRVFTVWEVDHEVLGNEAKVWSPNRLARTRGTRLGAADFATLVPSRLAEQRGAFVDGKFTPVPPSSFRRVAVEEQVDAVLFLGARTPDRPAHEVPRALCRDQQFIEEQVRRILLSAPNSEAQRLQEYCATVR